MRSRRQPLCVSAVDGSRGKGARQGVGVVEVEVIVARCVVVEVGVVGESPWMCVRGRFTLALVLDSPLGLAVVCVEAVKVPVGWWGGESEVVHSREMEWEETVTVQERLREADSCSTIAMGEAKLQMTSREVGWFMTAVFRPSICVSLAR